MQIKNLNHLVTSNLRKSVLAIASAGLAHMDAAAAAAKIILDGVKMERWRILVGDDAHRLDERVRQAPERAYEAEFYQSFAAEVGWRLG